MPIKKLESAQWKHLHWAELSGQAWGQAETTGQGKRYVSRKNASSYIILIGQNSSSYWP